MNTDFNVLTDISLKQLLTYKKNIISVALQKRIKYFATVKFKLLLLLLSTGIKFSRLSMGISETIRDTTSVK